MLIRKDSNKMKHILLTIILATAYTTAMAQLAPIHLWDNTPMKASGVTLTPFLPTDTAVMGRTAVIVCPGGSYFWLDMETEGFGVAQWLSDNGIAAFVLHYRTAGVPAFVTHDRLFMRGHRHPDMIQDAQRAILYLRAHAADYGIDPHRIGVMGFSAGGHLAMMTGEYFSTDFIHASAATADEPLRPDFVAPIYPVVTMTDSSVHKRSRRALLGEWGKSNTALRDSLSLERHVTTETPPVFLVNCKDDPIVNYHNAELLDSALTQRHVEHRYIQYATGGHGFGATGAKTTAEAIQWKGEFLSWLASLFGSRGAVNH